MKALDAFALALATVIMTCASAAAEPQVAALLPLTGPTADQGEWARRGFEIAREELAHDPAGKVSVSYDDSKGDPATAVQAYKALQARGRTEVVFSYGSGIGLALSPLVNSDHVVQMGIATATPKYRSEADYTFRNFPSAALEAEFVAHQLIDQLQEKNIAMLNIENDYGVGTSGAVKSAFTGLHGNVIFESSYPPGETDFRTLLTKLRATNVKLVYLAAYPVDGALLMRQAKQLGLHQTFLGSVAIVGGKEFFNAAGDAAEGLLVVSTTPSSNNAFSKAYHAKFPDEAPAQLIYAARAYDALMLVGKALAACKEQNADCVKDSLFRVKSYHGASGEISFDSCGDISSNFTLFRIQNRSFEPWKP